MGTISLPQERGWALGLASLQEVGLDWRFPLPPPWPPPHRPPPLISLLLCFRGSALKGEPGICPVFGVLFPQGQNNII